MQTGKLFTAAALAVSLFLAAASSKAQNNPTTTKPTDTTDAKQKNDTKPSPDGNKTATDDSSAKHGVVTPRDAASGQASGKRQHKPLVIKSEDKGTSTASGSSDQDLSSGQTSSKRHHKSNASKQHQGLSARNSSKGTQGQSTSNSDKKDDKTNNPAPPKN